MIHLLFRKEAELKPVFAELKSIHGSDINLYEVRTLSELENLRESWRHLVINAPTATPFQTWEWNFGMATFEKNRVSLRVVVAKNGHGDVIGIAPLWIHSNGFPGLSILEFIEI
jgi:hypothetical protein